jgi:putative inorganic carbon (hco3(-)) transporter
MAWVTTSESQHPGASVSLTHERHVVMPLFLTPDRARPSRRQLPSPLTVTLFATLLLAPLEGYLLNVNGNLGKVAPGAFLLTWVLSRLWWRRPLGRAHLVVGAVAGMTFSVLLSTLANPGNEFGLFSLGRWLPFLVLTVALVDVLSTDVHPNVAMTALVLGAVGAGAGSLFSFIVLGDARATGPLSDPNDLAYVLTAAVPIVLVRLGVGRGRAALASAAALAVLVAGSAATVSRGGAIAAGAVLVWVTLRRLVPARLLAAGLALVSVLGLAVLLVAGSQVETALGQKSNIAATNIDTRTFRWEAALRMLADHPVLGVGPGGFRPLYVEYSRMAELDELTPVTHEMYLEVAAETGVVGLAFFVGAILAAASSAEVAIRRLKAAGARVDDPLTVAAYCAQGSLLAVCISSSFLSEEYYMPLWAAIAASAAVELRTRTLPRRPARALALPT